MSHLLLDLYENTHWHLSDLYEDILPFYWMCMKTHYLSCPAGALSEGLCWSCWEEKHLPILSLTKIWKKRNLLFSSIFSWHRIYANIGASSPHNPVYNPGSIWGKPQTLNVLPEITTFDPHSDVLLCQPWQYQATTRAIYEKSHIHDSLFCPLYSLCCQHP